MEPFESFPSKKWSELLQSLERDWPAHSVHYNWAFNAIKIRKKDPSMAQEIYCLKTGAEFVAFVGIQKFGIDIITVFTFSGGEEFLEAFLLKTEVINWTREIYFPSVQDSFYPAMKSILEKKKIFHPNMTIKFDTRLLYKKSREECVKVEIGKIPDGFELGPIQKCDVVLISSVWPLRNVKNPERTEKHFNENLKFNRAAALFKKNDGTPVSWIFHGTLGQLHALQTLEEYRRRGFGKLVLNVLSRELAMEENLDSNAFVVKGNQASCNIFESLGFKFCKNYHFVNINQQ